MKQEKKIVSAKQALIMLVVGIIVIVVGLQLGINNRIVLIADGIIMCLLSVLFGIKYDDLQVGIKETVTSMIVAILILISVGILVGTWMASGTVPVMIYYGMQLISPAVFLPVTCIVCTLVSTMAGTSWGTLATVGVAFMGVAEGLGVSPAVTAGAIVVGAFFGDKVSPLSDSPVLVSGVTEVPLMEGIKHSLISTGPAYLASLVFFTIYGLGNTTGSIGGETYDAIMTTVAQEFTLTPFLLLPPLTVMVLILLKKPTIPVFVAGIVVGALLAIFVQGESFVDVCNIMYNGFSSGTGIEVVDKMLSRGGMTSMLGTIGLLFAAAIFGAPLRTAGVVEVLFNYVKKFAKNSKIMTTLVLILHAGFFTITGAYYVSYPVVGSMVKDLYPEYGVDKKNLMRVMLDTGTGLAPLVPWATTGAYVAATLGVANMDFALYAPMLWGSIIITFVIGITGIGTAKIKEAKDTKKA